MEKRPLAAIPASGLSQTNLRILYLISHGRGDTGRPGPGPKGAHIERSANVGTTNLRRRRAE